MKKIMYLLYMAIVCLCLALSPISASAKSTNNYTDFEMTDINGDSTTIKSLSGKSVILIFGRMGELLCGNTYATVTNINSVLSKSNDDSLCAYYLDIEDDNTQEEITKNMRSMSNITTCYKPNNYNEQSWELYFSYNKTSGSASVTLPMVFYINDKGKICDYSEGPLSTEDILKKIDTNFDMAIDMDVKNDNASGMCGENVSWTFNDGILTISGKGDMYWRAGFFGMGNP